jgi:hypothetical protein
MINELGINSQHIISIMPKSGPCYDFQGESVQNRKTIWLVPHVIKFKEESEVITWRCNWGNICESRCLYAMTKDKSWQSAKLVSN